MSPETVAAWPGAARAIRSAWLTLRRIGGIAPGDAGGGGYHLKYFHNYKYITFFENGALLLGVRPHDTQFLP